LRIAPTARANVTEKNVQKYHEPIKEAHAEKEHARRGDKPLLHPNQNMNVQT
jgi:hypothetical protein